MSEIVRTFIGTKCEGCGDVKRKNTAFCVGCYGTLPKELKNPLWKRFSNGFEDAYKLALEWLEKDHADTDRLLTEPE